MRFGELQRILNCDTHYYETQVEQGKQMYVQIGEILTLTHVTQSLCLKDSIYP